MSVRLVIGRAGSGKTHFLHEKLVTHLQRDPLNERVIWLAPKQATFTVERAIAEDERLDGFLNAHVIAPDDLAELVLLDTGAPAGARLDAVGRGLILGHLLRTHAAELRHFGPSATQPGLASEIDAAFNEFENAGQDLTAIDQLINDASKSDDSHRQALARKLTDLRHLYTLYQRFLANHGLDAFGRQQQALAAIENAPLVQQSLVIIDDFYDFTAYERSLICAMAKTARRMFISLLLDPHAQPDTFRRTQAAQRKLLADLKACGATVDAPIELTDHPRFRNAELVALEREAEAAPEGHVRLATATDHADEVELAARHIRTLTARGYRLRDICVLARSIEDYEPLIDTVFSEHGVAYFVDRRRSAQYHPLVRTLMAIAQIVLSRWSHEAVCDLARTGLTDTTSADADLLDDYIRQHHIPPAAWLRDEPWTYHRPVGEERSARPLFTDEEVERVNDTRVALRRALAPLRAWSEPQTVRQLLESLHGLLGDIGVRRRMQLLIEQAERDQQIQQRDEHELVWKRIAELSDQLVDLLGEVVVTGAQFAQLLQTTLSELELAIAPPTLDQVLVGSVERTRPRNPRAVILLGMNAQQFPRVLAERPLLNDADRTALLAAGVEVQPPSRQALLDERFLGYLALTRASESLLLLRRACDDSGNELEPSRFWHLAERVGSAVRQVGEARTARQIVSHTLDWVRTQAAPPQAGDPMAAIYDWLARSPTDAVRAVRDRAWPSLTYANQARVAGELAARLHGNRLEASVSRIESFASCPFQHFARYGLALQEPPAPDVTSLDLGNLYHSVLERLIRRTIERHVDFASAPDLEPPQIRAIAQEVGEQLRHQVFLSSARNRYTLEQLEGCVYKLIRAQQFAAERGTLRPSHAELVFGAKGDIPSLELTTPNGNKLSLRGKIDRVDIDPQRGRFTVIDYKLSGESLDLCSVYHGLMLQLLTYLLVLESHGEALAGKPLTPAAALYVKLLRSIDSTTDPSECAEPGTPEFHGKSKPRGLIDINGVSSLDATLTTESQAYAIKLKKDGGLYASGNDAVRTEQFQQLVIWVHDKLVALADAIIGGDVSVSPYLIGGYTPCGTCPYHRVCRFDRLINDFKVLEKLKRGDALRLMTGTGEGEEEE